MNIVKTICLFITIALAPVPAWSAQSEVANFYLEFARILLPYSGHNQSWRLQYLTDLARLPDYEPGPGYGYDGGFADKIVVDQITLVRIPDNVPFALGAAGTDAGMTSHHAVIAKGRVVAGTKLGIIGLGGLGQIGARVGVLAGAEVYVAEIDEEVWDLAGELGVTGVARSIRDFSDRQLDVSVDFAGFGTTTAEAIETGRFGGRVVQVGMGKLEATISTRDLIIKEIELVGCRGGTKDDVAGVYELFATGQLAPHYAEIGFDDIPDGLDRLARGLVKGRLVARINDAH